MHDMSPTVIDDPVARCVNLCLSVRLSVTRLRRAKTAKQIELMFGIKTVEVEGILF